MSHALYSSGRLVCDWFGSRCRLGCLLYVYFFFFFFFQAEDGIRDTSVTGVQTCALPISATSRWIDFTVQPASVLSKFRVAFVSIRSGWYPSFSSSLDKAIEKQPACAAATSSSGFVPGVSPNRVAKLYGMPLRAPLNVDTVPFPSFRPPFHCALARRSIESPAGPKSNGNLNVCLLRWISHEVPPFR